MQQSVAQYLRPFGTDAGQLAEAVLRRSPCAAREPRAGPGKRYRDYARAKRRR